MAKWIKTNGETVEVQPENGRDFSLAELYRYTNGGPIEIVRPDSNRDMDHFIVTNEEGKITGLPPNILATLIYNNPFDSIVGDILLCDAEEVQ